MNIVQQKLVNAYVILVLAGEVTLEELPKARVIGGEAYPIRTEVEKAIIAE